MAFQENLSVIFDELQMAKQWGKASIIFTIHKSTFSQDKTKKKLRKALENRGWMVIDLEINKIQGNFIDYMIQHENLEDIVFYISNINWGGGRDERDGYRILNLYRETFVEQNLKAIFFLTSKEALTLPSYAPDFWAFRHRVLEFENPHAPNPKRPPVGIMAWNVDGSIDPIDNTNEKVSTLTMLLTNMPDQAESVSLRIDLQYELGYLYWRGGDHLSAEKYLKGGIDLAKAFDLTHLLPKFLNGLAIIYYERENYQQASEFLKPLIRENPHDCQLLLNQAIVLFAQNKRYIATIKGKKAASICSQNPWIWNSLGFLYHFAGKMEEALVCFQQAIEISPKSAFFYEALVICYMAMGLRDKANVQLYRAQALSDKRKILQDILKLYVEDNDSEKVAPLLKAALDSGKLTKASFSRDPILGTLIAVSKIF